MEKQQIGQTLLGEPKSGSAKQWRVYVKEDTVVVEWGRIGGKLQTKMTTCIGKNIGKANETTPPQQAVLEAEAKWNKQWDKYYRPTIEEVLELEMSGVMLAQDYTKKPHFLKERFYVSPKLDGLRVKTTFEDGEPVWSSRGGKTYQVPGHLVAQLKTLHNVLGLDVLDGEGYIHNVKLQKTQSAIKKTNELTKKVTYQVFDIPMLDTIWDYRLHELRKVAFVVKSYGLDMINVVEQKLIDKTQIPSVLADYLEQGFEGTMYRNPKGLYEFKNKRSNDLLKHKEFFDSEAMVIDCIKDKNDEGVLTCAWAGVSPKFKIVTFELKMRGNHEYRGYGNQQTLIGKWITFKYQDLTEDGVPTFAVGLGERDCDDSGKPLE